MKNVVTILFFFPLFAWAQTKPHLGNYQFDSLYSSLLTSVDTTYKPVIMGSDGKYRKLTYWPVGGSSTHTLQQVTDAGSTTTTSTTFSGYSTTGHKLRVGDMVFQPYGLNNAFFVDNLYYNTTWKYLNTGYGAGFQFFNGQLLINTAPSGTAGATATPAYPFKADFNGSVALGGNINTTLSNFTGAGLVANANGAFVQGGYLNFSSTSGSTGYGIRNNAGTMEYKNSSGSWAAISSGGSLADGDKGDITVSGTGATWTVDNGAIDYSELSGKPSDLTTFTPRYNTGSGDGTANVSIPVGQLFYELREITAASNLTVGLSTSSTSGNQTLHHVIANTNTDATYNWTYTSTVKKADGTTVTSIPRGKTHTLFYIVSGDYWLLASEF